MTHLETICQAYNTVGIGYVLRDGDDGGYTYLFLCNEKFRRQYQTADLEELLRTRSFMEFKDGMLASY
jgi:hypothetical protein